MAQVVVGVGVARWAGAQVRRFGALVDNSPNGTWYLVFDAGQDAQVRGRIGEDQDAQVSGGWRAGLRVVG